MALKPVPIDEGSNVSLLSSIGKGISQLASNIVKPLAAATPFVPALAPLTAVAGVISKIAPSTNPVKVPTPIVPSAAPTPIDFAQAQGFAQPVYTAPVQMAAMPSQASVGLGDILKGAAAGAAGALGGSAIGGVINTFTGALAPSGGGSSCGCGSRNGRDPCTHQRIGSKNNPAPLATFFGGCCPPGRVLRRKPMGRDICIKQPKMNVFNPRALARADMRITGFVRRAAPILHDMGFKVERTRHAHGVKIKGRKRARR